MADEPRIIAGAMSGTSADGVDVALTKIMGRGYDMTAQLLQHHHRPYDDQTRREIFAFRGNNVRENFLSRLATLGRTISLTYATAVNEALAATHLSAKDLSAVAAHGQTLFHDPPSTIQWLDPTLVAAEVGCPVISDFRRADLAAGGQGAPLVPFADYILFRHPTKNRVLLNIGGIANITWLPAGCQPLQVIAFDTGPGNCISDHLMRVHEPDGPGFDRDGARASTGAPNPTMVERFLAHPYFDKPPPKSTDGPEMIQAWTAALRGHEGLPLQDQLATACRLTATSILQAITARCASAGGIEIIASGGGTRNRAIMSHLKAGPHPLVMTSDNGVPSDAKEALAFALLGAATLDDLPANIPSVTGAKRGVVMGCITPRP